MIYIFLLIILPLTYLGCPIVAGGVLFDHDHKLAPPLRNFLFFGALAWMEAVALFIYSNGPPGDTGWLKLVSIATGLTLALALAFNPWFRFKAHHQQSLQEFSARKRESIEDVVKRSARKFPDVDISTATALTQDLVRRDQEAPVYFPGLPGFSVCLNPRVHDSVREEIARALSAPGREEQRVLETALAVQESLSAVNAVIPRSQEGLFEVPLGQYLRAPGNHIWNIIKPFYANDRASLGIGNSIRAAYEANRLEISQGELSAAALRNGAFLEPWAYGGADAFHRYLKNTPFAALHGMTARLGIPAAIRPEHGVIVGKTGAGKSQLLEKLILADLRQDDPPGMLIIDSKADEGSLFNRIPRLDVFHPGHGRLRDRLIIIDPVHDKPALNMFSFSGELTSEKVNQINASMRYFFGGLLGDELSGQMNTLFLPLLHVILRVPGATLHDLQRLVRDPLQYPDVLEQIPAGIRRFLLEEFSSRSEGYRTTKQSLITRIQGIINEVTLDDMFSAPTNAFDVAEALGEGRIILVSTNAQALQHLSPIFGKYWIAQTLNAGMSRKGNRPIHFYCDEAAPYVDDKLQTMLTTLRSYNLGVMLAFQGVWQMGVHTRAILGQTNIKFISGADEADAAAFAPFYKGMEAGEIHSVRKQGAMAAFAMQHSELEQAVTVRFPFGELDREPHMPEADHQRLRRLNAERLRSAPPVREDFPGREAEERAARVPVSGQSQPGTSGPDATPAPSPARPRSPARKIAAAPSPAPGGGSPAPRRRRKAGAADAPDTTGSKPTAEW